MKRTIFSTTLLRCFLFFATILFMAVGAAMMAMGIWLRVDPSVGVYLQIAASRHPSGELFSAVCTFMAVVGAIALAIGVLGFWGVYSQSVYKLNAFAVAVTIVSLLQIIVGIIAVVYSTRLGPQLQAAMTQQCTRYYDGISSLSHAWDYMQVHLECCGSDKPADWSLNYWQKPDGYKTPRSCCRLRVKDHTLLQDDSNVADVPGCQALNPDAHHERGCYPVLRDWVWRHATLVATVALALLVVQVLAIFAACALRIRSQRDEMPESAEEMQPKPKYRHPLPQQRVHIGIQNRYPTKIQ